MEVCKWFRELGYKIYYTKTPTETDLGKFCREQNGKLSPISLACLLASDKYQCVKEEIQPKLDDGNIVLCDRFILSAYLYNNMDGVDFDFTRGLYSEILKPDHNFVLELDASLVIENINNRDSKSLDKYELDPAKERETLNKAVEYCKSKGDYVEVIPVTKDLEANTRLIISKLLPIFNEKNILTIKDAKDAAKEEKDTAKAAVKETVVPEKQAAKASELATAAIAPAKETNKKDVKAD